MTTANETCRTAVTGSGAGGQVVPFTFPISASSDLEVIQRVTATGVETVLAETTNYTVTDPDGATADWSAGGNVTTVTAVAATAQIHVIRKTPNTQTLDLVAGASFSAESVEAALDRNTRNIIENTDALDRTLRFPDTDPIASIGDMPNSIDRASKWLYFGDDGVPTAAASVTPSTSTVSAFMETVLDDADGEAALTTMGGIYVINVKTYGATGDGVTNDTTAIATALSAVGATGATVYFPAGTYITEPMTIPTQCRLVGNHMTKSVIKLKSGSNDDLLQMASIAYVFMSDLTLNGNGANNTGTIKGLDMSDSHTIEITRCRFTDFEDFGIWMDTCNAVDIVKCFIDKCNAGVYSTTGEEINLIRCVIQENATYGVKYVHTSGTGSAQTIQNCWFENQGETPTDYVILDAVDHVSVLYNKFFMTGTSNSAINCLTGASYNLIMGNVAHGTIAANVILDSGSFYNAVIFNAGGAVVVTDNDGRNYTFNSNPTVGGAFHETGRKFQEIDSFADDATPSVRDGNLFLTGGTTTITDFDDGETGQIITVIAEHSLTITDGTNIFLSGSANWAMTATDTLTLICKADNKWYETARSDSGA